MRIPESGDEREIAGGGHDKQCDDCENKPKEAQAKTSESAL